MERARETTKENHKIARHVNLNSTICVFFCSFILDDTKQREPHFS